MRLVIHAPNVHQGGGQALLSAFLRLVAERSDVVAIVDSRLGIPKSMQTLSIDSRVPPTMLGRLRAERRLRMLTKAGTTILCFGNLPPLYHCRGRTLLFLQNRYLTGGLESTGFSLRERLRIAAERMWLRMRIRNVDEVIVQGPSMAKEVEKMLGVRARVLSFMPEIPLQGQVKSNEKVFETQRFDFVYVASGEPHKNHDRLLDAWRLLAAEGIKPSLALTVDPNLFPALVARIKRTAASGGLQIENIGQASSDEIQALYRSTRALIYPSLGESLGLPLLEARACGLPVVAPERDYVRDVVEPVETFDPQSPVSIARAVKRFLNVPQSTQTVLTPQQFLEAILSG
jgi:glycosyltransferase involved in cell wall biosynthesis